MNVLSLFDGMSCGQIALNQLNFKIDKQAHNIPIGYTSICNDRERSLMLGNGWTVDVITHILKHIV